MSNWFDDFEDKYPGVLHSIAGFVLAVALGAGMLFASVGVIVKAAEFFGVRAIIVKIEK